MKKAIVVLGILAVILIVVLSAGCTGSQTSDVQKTASPTLTPPSPPEELSSSSTTSSPTSIPTVIQTATPTPTVSSSSDPIVGTYSGTIMQLFHVDFVFDAGGTGHSVSYNLDGTTTTVPFTWKKGWGSTYYLTNSNGESEMTLSSDKQSIKGTYSGDTKDGNEVSITVTYNRVS